MRLSVQTNYIKLFILSKCFFILLLILFSLFFNVNLFAQETFNIWIKSFKEEAVSKGISKETLNLLNDLKPLKKTISLDRNQPEFKLTFNDYFNKVVTKPRIKKAKKEYLNNKELLNKISKKYNVQGRFIISLWAIESDFGRNMGNFNAIQTLMTLAFDGRRSKYFRKELLALLKIIDSGDVANKNIKSGWAGALGQSQFMPSSYIAYAQDCNNDGLKDIWNNKEDVFCSIANYLKKNGWNNKFTWGRRVSANKFLDYKNQNKNLLEWSQMGITKEDGNNLPKINLKSRLIFLDNNPNLSFLVYNNYNVLLRWNRSNYFAVSVGLLSNLLSK